ncbi:MAG: AarF/ABC1/UbiB kinase family protein [Rhodospirillaceae bacterium]|nr:AarF/ABC1/UbiB kinase family protein [Rhodospirillaceae bacterium]
MNDNSSLGGRVRRYVRASRAVSGLAARVAGERYLGVKFDRKEHAAELRASLGGLKGPLMKVAQLLSTIPEALPREYAQELAQLQSDAPPMGWAFVRRRMVAELGPDWRGRFEQFDREASAAASLGQVHRAVTKDGVSVACKLQYPEMASVVAADLKQLRIIFGLYGRYDKAIDTANIHKEISARLLEELDYEREAAQLALYRLILQKEPSVHVPEVLPDLSTDRLLTMTWLEGRKLTGFEDAPVEVRNALAHNMFRAWYVPFYYYGVIHGDPHFGNYAARDDHSINLLDFGCIRVFPPTFVKGVIDLYNALKTNDGDLAVHAYETWGFKDLDREIIDVLNIWARFVYKPLMKDKVQAIQQDNSVQYGAETVGKVHEELKRVGGVRPPREFVLMDRAAIGLGSVFMRLQAEVNWHQLFHGMIDDFDVDKLAKRQKKALKKVKVPEAM